jgi:hypothetical protein
MSDSVPLSTLLNRLAAELRRDGDRLARIDHAVADLFGVVDVRRLPRFQELQEIDRVRQEIAGIADIVAALADACPAELRADARLATGAVTLEALARALAMGETVENGVDAIEIFD